MLLKYIFVLPFVWVFQLGLSQRASYCLRQRYFYNISAIKEKKTMSCSQRELKHYELWEK